MLCQSVIGFGFAAPAENPKIQKKTNFYNVFLNMTKWCSFIKFTVVLCTARFSKRVISSDCDTVYTIYQSLCTQSADVNASWETAGKIKLNLTWEDSRSLRTSTKWEFSDLQLKINYNSKYNSLFFTSLYRNLLINSIHP